MPIKIKDTPGIRYREEKKTVHAVAYHSGCRRDRCFALSKYDGDIREAMADAIAWKAKNTKKVPRGGSRKTKLKKLTEDTNR